MLNFKDIGQPENYILEMPTEQIQNPVRRSFTPRMQEPTSELSSTSNQRYSCNIPNLVEKVHSSNNQTIPAAYFSFGIIQTPFQIISGWPIRFKNNKVDHPTDFISQLNRFQRGYQIGDVDIF